MNSTTLMNRLTINISAMKKKELEIDKRKELIQQMEQSEVNQKKNEIKENKIDVQIESHRKKAERKRFYFENEIKNAEDKYEKIVREAKEQFEKYRNYCLNQIQNIETTTDDIIETLEKQKDISIPSFSDDKILKRLEIELKQLQDENQQLFEQHTKQSQLEFENKKREMKEEEERRLYNERMQAAWKREQYLQELAMKKAKEEKEKEEKRQKTQFEIETIMKRENCSYDVAKDMYTYNISKQGAIHSKQKQQDDIQQQSKLIRQQYPQYKFIVSELDKEYTKKMIELPEDKVKDFFETLKPLIEMKLKFEEDTTLLDDKHQQMYETLTLDQKFECHKIKSKQKRYLYIQKYHKTRAEQINESLGCV